MQGCEKPIDIDATAVDCKPTVVDLNLVDHDDNQGVDEHFDENALDSPCSLEQFDNGNESDSSESFQLNKSSKQSGMNSKRAMQPIGHTECEICGRTFSNKSNLRFHQRNSHSLKYIYNCKMCDKQFEYKKELRLHRLKDPHVQAHSYECWMCHEA